MVTLSRKYLRNLFFNKYTLFCILIGVIFNHYIFVETKSSLVSYKKNAIFEVLQKRNNKITLLQNNKKYIFYCRKNCETFSSGDEIKFNALLFPVKNSLVPNGYNVSYQHPEISGTVVPRSKISILVDIKKTPLSQVRDRFLILLKKNIRNPIGYSLLTGNKKELPKELYEKFKITGTAHILAISGMHIGGIAFIFFIIFRKFFSLFRSFSEKYNNKNLSLIAGMLAAIFFLFIAGFPISGQRALLFLCFFFLASFLGVRNSLSNIFFLTVTILLLLNPYNIFLVGFQLSFVAVASIIIMLKICKNKENMGTIRKSLYISSAITIFTLPITVFYFQSGNLLSPLFNLLVVPLVSIFIIPLGIASIFFSFIGLGKVFFYLFNTSLNFLENIVNIFSRINLSPTNNVLIAHPSLLLLLVIIIIFLIFEINKKTFFINLTLYIFIFLIPRNYPDISLFSTSNFFIVKNRDGFFISKLLKNEFTKNSIESYYPNLGLVDLKLQENEELSCLEKVCKLRREGKVISLIYKKVKNDELQKICIESDLLIYARKSFLSCYNTPTITGYNIQRQQKINIFIKNKQIFVK